MNKRFVVIGASAASVAFITKLRSIDPVSEIVCITGEAELPYNRCFLADYLSGDTLWSEMQLKPETFFKDHRITLRLNTWVTKLDTQNKMVFIGSEQVSYDHLFLGVGTKPYIPPVGVDTSFGGVFTFHTADDINQVSSFIDKNPGAHMVVIGAGLNGLECAASLRRRSMQVTIVERNDQILPAQVDQDFAIYISKMVQHEGINLICGVGVLQIDRDNATSGYVVKLQNGQNLTASGIVFATGSIVHDELLQDSGIATQQGAILVDSAMKTNVSDVYAAGDICMVTDSMTGKLVKSATWADAMLQGLCAATQLSDRPRLYPGYVGLRDSVFFGYEFYACGQTVGFDESVEIVRKDVDQAKQSFYLKDGILIGFVLFKDVSKVAQYKQWYMTRKFIEKSDF